MWDIRRAVLNAAARPVTGGAGRRFVAEFHLAGAPPREQCWWLVFEAEAVDLCYRRPGFAVDLRVETGLRALTQIWLGHLGLDEALREGGCASRVARGRGRLPRLVRAQLLGAGRRRNPAADSKLRGCNSVSLKTAQRVAERHRPSPRDHHPAENRGAGPIRTDRADPRKPARQALRLHARVGSPPGVSLLKPLSALLGQQSRTT